MPSRSAVRTLAAALMAASSAGAAEVTEVADAMEPGRPIEIDLDVGYRHLRRDTRLTRENVQADGSGLVLVDELNHVDTVDEMAFRLAVGIFHDLEIHLVAPLVLRESQTWNQAGPTSTLASNRIDVSGCAAAGSCQTVAPIVSTPGRSLRTGFRDPTIGVAWGP